MTHYPFALIEYRRAGPITDSTLLLKRPFTEIKGCLREDAQLYVPGDLLETAINTALAVGEPILITGESGTGKTQAAYYAAYKLGVEPVMHFQVKSDTTAKDLLYHFDTVRYFHDAHMEKEGRPLDKANYIEKRALWQAFEAAVPQVLLIDEIDKAPRDFPNDLLHELDQMEFYVPEISRTIQAARALRPVVFITSNSERRLPEPFLRRCVYHHLQFDEALVREAVNRRRASFARLSDSLIDTAMRRFMDLRSRPLRKLPSTGEFLVWLRILSIANGTYPEPLEKDLSKLPYLGTLLKDHQDIADVGRGR
ncbi:MAG: MoxR family ATPase [Magnetococcus sp. YQC-5]